MDGHVAGEERQAVGQFEDLLVQGAAVPQPGAAQRRLMNQLQRQAWSHTWGFCPVQPHTKSCGPQAEQFRDEQPNAGPGFSDLIKEELSHPVFDARGS